MGRSSIRGLMAVVVGAGLLLAGGGLASGQQPTPVATRTPTPAATGPDGPRDGDFVWAFAQDLLFTDPRVVMAFAVLMQPTVARTEASVPGLRIVAADPTVRGFVAQSPLPTERAPLLLAAAGVSPTAFTGTNGCNVWTVPASPATTREWHPEKVGLALGSALNEALLGLGIPSDPCAITPNLLEANIVVWVQGAPPPTIPPAPGRPLLTTVPRSSTAPARPPPPAGGPAAPRPPAGGNAGTLPMSEATPWAQASMVSAAVALAVGARLLVDRHRREDAAERAPMTR